MPVFGKNLGEATFVEALMRGKANLSEPLLPENVRAKVQDKELCQGRINSINPEYISYYMEQLIRNGREKSDSPLSDKSALK
jgi:hypothetical protein